MEDCELHGEVQKKKGSVSAEGRSQEGKKRKKIQDPRSRKIADQGAEMKGEQEEKDVDKILPLRQLPLRATPAPPG